MVEIYNTYIFLCKGHVDPGESNWVTALRETKEEAGYSENELEVSLEIPRILLST